MKLDFKMQQSPQNQVGTSFLIQIIQQSPQNLEFQES